MPRLQRKYVVYPPEGKRPPSLEELQEVRGPLLGGGSARADGRVGGG